MRSLKALLRDGMVSPSWAAQLHHAELLVPRPQRKRRRKYEAKGLEG